MIIDLLIVAVCVYMSYTNIQMLAGTPLSGWGIEQFLLAAVTFLLMIVGVYKGYKLISAFITAQKRAAQQAKELQAQGDAEREAAADEDEDDE